MARPKNIPTQQVKDFLNSTSYYYTRLHTKKCRICKLPENHKKVINRMLLEGKSTTVVGTYLIQRFPHIFSDFEHLSMTIQKHAEYLPLLISDVEVKSIFTRARYILEKKDFADMTEVEKAETISEIEKEIIQEYGDIERERMSMLKVMFDETLPMMLMRLNAEVEHGTARDIRDITEASKSMLQMASVLAMTNVKETPNKVTVQDVVEYDDAEEQSGQKLISLTERLEQSTNR